MEVIIFLGYKKKEKEEKCIMLAYKVVEKQTRHCTNFTLMKSCCSTSEQLEMLVKWRKKYRKWFPTYRKNTTVSAPKGSLGIMTFQRRWDAEEFIEEEFSSAKNSVKIISVKGINKLSRPNCILAHAGNVEVGTYIDEVETPAYNFMSRNAKLSLEYHKCRPVPDGLVCFEGVEVLE